MRQLIARIDDELHQRLKARAIAEGRSMNALVVEVLAAAAPPLSERARLRMRLRAEGLLYEPPPPEGPVPTPDELRVLLAGSGTAVSEALAEDRASR